MDTEMSIWLSDAFTRAFQETLDDYPAIAITELVAALQRVSTGSHPSIYNEANYGNLYHQDMREFLPDKVRLINGIQEIAGSH